MKLTTLMKERIIKSILDETFGKRTRSLADDKQKLADDVYASYYAPHAANMKKIPEEFFFSQGIIDIKANGVLRTEFAMSTTRLFGACHQYRPVEIPPGSDLEKRLISIQKRSDLLKDDRKALERTLNSVIMPVTTDKKLIEVWPDAEKWIPTTPAATANLPAIRPEDLNAMILDMQLKEEDA